MAETRGCHRGERLSCLAGLPGVYVPAFSTCEFTDRGVEIKSRQQLPIKRQIVLDMDTAFAPSSLIVPDTGIIHDRVPVEVFRGCSRGCRFCQAGMIYRPVRERSPGKVIDIARDLLKKTGWEEVGLVSLSSCDYTGLVPVLETLSRELRAPGIKLSLPSLRMDASSVELAASLETVKRGGLTFAPEAGSQHLRDVINKGIDEEDIRTTLEALSEHGWDRVKLYFMVGLPTETETDLQGILDICREAFGILRKRHRRAEVSVSVNGFIPKPHTPFQWEPQLLFWKPNPVAGGLRGNLGPTDLDELSRSETGLCRRGFREGGSPPCGCDRESLEKRVPFRRMDGDIPFRYLDAGFRVGGAGSGGLRQPQPAGARIFSMGSYRYWSEP